MQFMPLNNTTNSICLKEGVCKAQDILELIHNDVCGPLRTPTFKGVFILLLS